MVSQKKYRHLLLFLEGKSEKRHTWNRSSREGGANTTLRCSMRVVKVVDILLRANNGRHGGNVEAKEHPAHRSDHGHEIDIVDLGETHLFSFSFFKSSDAARFRLGRTLPVADCNLDREDVTTPFTLSHSAHEFQQKAFPFLAE